MNWLYHIMHARTAYGLHSPFVYALYTEVLAPRAVRGEPRCRAERIAHRIEVHFHAHSVASEQGRRLVYDRGEFLVIACPHRREAEWEALCADEFWQVSVDMFEVGVLIHNPCLHRERFLLR